MMKTNASLAALFLLSLTLPCPADTFTLKDGTTLEGKVISEAGDTYVIEVQVTKSIKDERRIAKADVVKRATEQPDLKAFEAIAKLVPTPDLMSADEYQTQIAAVEKFLKDFRSSSKTKDAKAILETLKSESAQVSDGGIKHKGRIYSRAEVLTSEYDFDSRVMAAKIHRLIDDRRVLEALRQFQDFNRDYSTTLIHGELAPVIRQLIQEQVGETKELLRTYDARVKQRAIGLDQMSAADRRTTEEAIKAENVAIEARYKAEKGAKQSWVTTSPYHKASLEDTVKFGEAELARLAAEKTVLGVDGGKAYRELHAAAHGGGTAADFDAALATAKAAKIPNRYLAPLEALVKDRK